MELFLKIFVRLVVKSAINFLAHAGNTFRSSLQSLSVYIFADSFEKKLVASSTFALSTINNNLHFVKKITAFGDCLFYFWA